MTETESKQTSESKQACGSPGCLCAGSGPALSNLVDQAMRQLGPSEPVRQHFRQARIEVLKGLRALLDEQITAAQQPASKGTRLSVD
jgi:hypothetical protein